MKSIITDKSLITIAAIAAVVAISAAAATANVRFTANANRATVPSGERATVTARLSSPKPLQVTPQPAASSAFSLIGTNTGVSQSTSVNFINGQMTQQHEYNYSYIYTIISNTDDPFTFPALTVNIDGAAYSSPPVHFNGGGAGRSQGQGGGGQGAQQQQQQQQQQRPDVIASLSMSKRTLYKGEQAVLTLKFMHRANASVNLQRGVSPMVDQVEKTLGKDLTLTRLFTNQLTQGQENVGGETYLTYSLRYSVMGLTPGEYSIPAIPFEYDELHRSSRNRRNPFFSDLFDFDMDFFGGSTQAVRKSTRTAPFTVTVKPLPAGAPAGFTGSVGKFSLSATAEPQEIPAGEAITLRVTLRGNTRAANVGDPVLPELKNCDVFPPERSTAVDTVADGFSTRKTYRYLIIPRRQGELALGAVTYPYFDPASGTYKTAIAVLPTVTVTAGKEGGREQTRRLTQEEIQQVGHDIRYIKTPARIANEPLRPYRAPVWYLLFPLPILIFIFALLYKIQSKRGEGDQIKSIRQKALRIAVRELNKASKGGTDNEFLGKASSVIEKYISNKFGFPATGRTLEELKDELVSRRIDEETVNGLAALVESINEYRFGGKKFDSQSRGSIISQTTKFLSSMEKSVQKGKAIVFTSSSASAVLFLLTAAALNVRAQDGALDAPEVDSAAEWVRSAGNVASAVVAWADQEATPANENALFKIANDFYAAGVYDSAQVYYTKITDAGISNAAVFYNLGNCYYRLEKPGLARLYYEKAALLSPKDPDIAANIRFIKSVIVDRSEDKGDDSDFLAAVFYGIHTLLPLSAQIYVLCALLFALSLCASLILFKRGLTRLLLAYAAALCAILLITVGTSVGYKIYSLEKRQYAIVLTESLDALNQPRGEHTLFTVHEGTKLQIRETRGEWSLVNLENGASGWALNTALGKI